MDHCTIPNYDSLSSLISTPLTYKINKYPLYKWITPVFMKVLDLNSHCKKGVYCSPQSHH